MIKSRRGNLAPFWISEAVFMKVIQKEVLGDPLTSTGPSETLTMNLLGFIKVLDPSVESTGLTNTY